MTEPKKSALEFPCSFPLKVIGKNTGDFEPKMVEIIRRHIPELNDQEVSSRLSRDGKYLAVTATFTAQSQEQLDGVYYELSSHELVMMVL
jgi:putative lipoic acid-binding regulatory protein